VTTPSRRRALIALGVLAPLLYLLAFPTDVAPVAWSAPKAPALEGKYARNGVLDAPELLATEVGVGPEHIVFDAVGRMIVGYADGRVVRLDRDGKNATTLASTGGRPLGLALRGDELIVADAFKGLLSISPTGAIRVLATEAEGVRLGFTDAVDVARDGTLYFSDASDKFDQHHYQEDLLEHGAHGRLLALGPNDASPRVLERGIDFANGVALAADDSFVLVNETGTYRVLRRWLTGPRAGQRDVLIDDLPGFPDNLTRSASGVFWIGLASPRSSALDDLAPHPFIRKIVSRLPRAVQPKAQRFAHVLGVDAAGAVRFNLQGIGKSYSFVTVANEHDGFLYLGSLTEPAIARVRFP
jgi:sugar lactone lactonase YvrE